MVTEKYLDLTIEGLEAIKRKLDWIDKETAEVLGDALYESGNIVKTKSQEIVPVKTGNLQRNHFVEKVSNFLTIVGVNAYYAPYVELGTSKMDAQPFLWPALEEKSKDVISLVANALKKDVFESVENK